MQSSQVRRVIVRTALSAAQAYVTVRKGNKKLALYDLTLVLSWAGRWEIDGKEVPPAVDLGWQRRPFCGDTR